MPQLERFSIEVRTGRSAGPDSPQYVINGFPLDFEDVEGSAAAGQTLRASGNPMSFPHALLLRGPEEGSWDIEGVRLTYECGAEPYTVELGGVVLDSESDLNIWHDAPMPTFDV